MKKAIFLIFIGVIFYLLAQIRYEQKIMSGKYPGFSIYGKIKNGQKYY